MDPSKKKKTYHLINFTLILRIMYFLMNFREILFLNNKIFS